MIIILLVIIVSVGWILAAMLTLKFDSMLSREPTQYWLILAALLLWWAIAILLLTDKHQCYDDKYHY